MAEQITANQQLTGDGFVKTCRHVFKTGVKGFWVTISRETIYGAVVFGGVPAFQTILRPHMPENLKSYRNFVAGLISSLVVGSFGAWISQPLDCLKTRLQTNPSMNYRLAYRSITKEGYKGFLKGFGPRGLGFFLISYGVTSTRDIVDYFLKDKKSEG